MSETKGEEKSVSRLGERVRAELAGITLLLAAVFLASAIITYNSADPSFNNAGTAGPVPQNAMGLFGSYVADLLIQILGQASFLIPIALLVFAVRYIILRPIRYPGWVAGGYVLITLLFATFSSLFFGEIHFDRDAFPAGGALGELLMRGLIFILNRPGAYLVVVTGLVCSLIFTVNFSLFAFGGRLRDKTVELLARLREWRATRKEEKARERELKEDRAEIRAAAVKKPPKIVSEKEPVHHQKVQETFDFVREVDGYKLPPLDIFEARQGVGKGPDQETLLMASKLLVKKLQDFGVECMVETVHPGPVVTMYEIKPAAGVKINKIVNLSDDLAMALRAQSIRIVAPIPGKDTVGVEIPNAERDIVLISEILNSQLFRGSESLLTIAMGKDIAGNPVVADLARMPHLLVAGATGSGKSVGVHSMLASLLARATPKDVRFIIVDPKMLELSVYDDIPHLLLPVVTEAKKAAVALKWAVVEMERRYRLMAEGGVRNITSHNKKVEKLLKTGDASPDEKCAEHLPYIVVIIDELADLLMVAAKDVEESIARLAQMARAAGIHLIVATQRPSVDVLTGMIKANFPARIAFQVASRVDSRTILDSMGAESLLGGGDMLFLPPGTAKINRVHGSYVSEQEITRLTAFLRQQGTPDYNDQILAADESGYYDDGEGEFDSLYDEAVRFVTEAGQASTSMVQRKFKIGYNRAANLIDMMEREGVVGPNRGAKPREVLAQRV
ncbi:DNA translocase FtsK [bacterium]|nr:MAG: DNA translocase FtsK [bacterium]